MRCTTLGSAACQGNIDRDLDVATRNMVRAGRADPRNEERLPDVQHPPRHQKQVLWRQQRAHGLTFAQPSVGAIGGQ